MTPAELSQFPQARTWESLMTDHSYLVFPPAWLGGHGHVVDAAPIQPNGQPDPRRPFYRQWYSGKDFYRQ